MLPKQTVLKNISHIYHRAIRPSLTYDLNLEQKSENWRLNKKIDLKKSLEQSIQKRLETEANTYEIYSPFYGLCFIDLIGRPKDFVESEIKERIIQNFKDDDRIERIFDFSFPPTTHKKSLLVAFTVQSIWGTFEMEANVFVS